MEEKDITILKKYLKQSEIDQLGIQRKIEFGILEILIRDGIPQKIILREKNIKLPLDNESADKVKYNNN